MTRNKKNVKNNSGNEGEASAKTGTFRVPMGTTAAAASAQRRRGRESQEEIMNDGKSFARFSHFALRNISSRYTSGNGGDDDCGEGGPGGGGRAR